MGIAPASDASTVTWLDPTGSLADDLGEKVKHLGNCKLVTPAASGDPADEAMHVMAPNPTWTTLEPQPLRNLGGQSQAGASGSWEAPGGYDSRTVSSRDVDSEHADSSEEETFEEAGPQLAKRCRFWARGARRFEL